MATSALAIFSVLTLVAHQIVYNRARSSVFVADIII